MKKKKKLYLIITLIFIIISITLLSQTDIKNNAQLSKTIEIILILYLIRISYGCILYIRKLYNKNKYSYSIIMNLGLLIFININILRQIDLLINNWNIININTIYNNTLESFSFFAMLTLPCITILSIFSIITNIVLIKKEGFKYKNTLGIFLSIFAILGLCGSQTLYTLTKQIFQTKEIILLKKIIDISINVTLSYFYSIIIATLYCNIVASRHTPKYNKDFIIILGSKINEDGTLTALLKARVDRAIKFGKNQKKETNKEIYYVPSGGQGKDEIISEAAAIKNYLIEQGIDKKNIIIEDKSTSTIENMKFSKNKIIQLNKTAEISFSTTNYHVFRSGVIASNCGMRCEGMGSKTKWYFYTNALIREFIANLFQEKNKHISILILINISALILVLIGYIFRIIKI